MKGQILFHVATKFYSSLKRKVDTGEVSSASRELVIRYIQVNGKEFLR